MKNYTALALLLLCSVTLQARQRQCFDADWLFMLADSAGMQSPDYHDSHWRRLSLPHDWAIEGDFHVGNPSGASGGALPGGTGWYRKHFQVANLSPLVSRHYIEFDGVYMNATVYVNGQALGTRPYGYSSFEYDITNCLREGDNVVAVRVDNSDQPNSRWYSGCGIYRHVWLTKTHPVHVKHWGVYVQTDAKTGRVKVDVELEGKGKVRNTMFDAQGKEVGLRVRNPRLWSVDDPYVYRVRTQVMAGGKVVDEVWTTTAFRNFRFDAQTGFWLNGKNMKLNGVCEHHDLGCLGAALHEDALHRKLLKLKAMGVNAIRTSHNPPAPELLNMCDTMGLIVMDESFDMWRRRKTQNDYARFFDQWHERDLTDLVLRDRNHPCILMWSIGNEVLEQWSSAEADTLTLEQANLILNAGHDAATLAKDGETSVQSLLTQHLADIVRRYDTTRPITAGCNEPSPNNHLFKSGALDIIGFNYHHEWVKDVPKNFPGQPFIFTESVSALQTRGNYMMPSDSIFKAPKEWWLPYTDPTYMCSAYDNMHASWSSTHEQTWDVVKHNNFVGGQFIWTGFDYIGEPTPYGFPARSSYFGLIDLAGFPKDTYYMYQSEWTEKPVLHLFPHWNWIAGDEVDLWCYYSQADEVELFVNGKSQGIRRKKAGSDDALSTEYHVGWRVVFDPGEAKVVARKNGKVVREQVIRTAGAPDHIRLSMDYKGKNLAFIVAEVVDKDGNLCPWADDEIVFIGEGEGRIIGTDNGCQTSMERLGVVTTEGMAGTAPRRKAFMGRCIAVVRSTAGEWSNGSANGSITAKSYNLKPDVINF